MKKLLMMMAIAGFLAACNNSGTSADSVKDSVLDKIDSSKEAKIDSIQDTTARQKDKVEATFEKTDSANKAINDSLKTK